MPERVKNYRLAWIPNVSQHNAWCLLNTFKWTDEDFYGPCSFKLHDQSCFLYFNSNYFVYSLSHVWFFCDPMDVLLCLWDFSGKNTRAGSFSRRSSLSRDKTHVSCLAGGFFTTEPPGKPSTIKSWTNIKKRGRIKCTGTCRLETENGIKQAYERGFGTAQSWVWMLDLPLPGWFSWANFLTALCSVFSSIKWA